MTTCPVMMITGCCKFTLKIFSFLLKSYSVLCRRFELDEMASKDLREDGICWRSSSVVIQSLCHRFEMEDMDEIFEMEMYDVEMVEIAPMDLRGSCQGLSSVVLQMQVQELLLCGPQDHRGSRGNLFNTLLAAIEPKKTTAAATTTAATTAADTTAATTAAATTASSK